MIRKFMRHLKRRITDKVDLQTLVERGLKIGSNCSIIEGAVIDPSHCWLIEIGNNVTVAPNVNILAHDASPERFLGCALIGRVVIGDNVFIGAGTTVLPNITIGSNSFIGAGSVVTRSIPANVVAAGNPARVRSKLDAFLDKHRVQLKSFPCFGQAYRIENGITRQMKEEMNAKLGREAGYLVPE